MTSPRIHEPYPTDDPAPIFTLPTTAADEATYVFAITGVFLLNDTACVEGCTILIKIKLKKHDACVHG